MEDCRVVLTGRRPADHDGGEHSHLPRVVWQRQRFERGFVMPQPGSPDYRTAQSTMSGHEDSAGIMDQGSERARDVGARAATMVAELGAAIKERPYTTLAIAAGLAFAVGA